MRKDEFKKWLRDNNYSRSAIINYVYFIKQVESLGFDIDKEFEKDECTGLLNNIHGFQGQTRNPKTKISDMKSAINAYVRFRKNQSNISLKPNNVVRINNSIKQVNQNNQPIKHKNHPPMGMDHEGNYVKYASDVKDDEKVPGLAIRLEMEYLKIIEIARELFIEELEIDFPIIPVILSKEKPHRRYYNDDNAIARMIEHSVMVHESSVNKRDIIRILNEREVVLDVVGMYLNQSDDRHIEIYYLNVDYFDFESYFINLIKALAHEYMHFIHNIYVGNIKFNFKSDKNTRVKEAIAELFSLLYLLKTQDDSVPYKEDASYLGCYCFWNQHYGSNIPYAEALNFYHSSNIWNYYGSEYSYYWEMGAIDKLFNVLHASKNDTDIDTYNVLIK